MPFSILGLNSVIDKSIEGNREEFKREIIIACIQGRTYISFSWGM